jgi:prevent-host-death family protein
MTQIDIAEALMHMPQLIDEASRGEEVIITKNNQPIVKLVPILLPKQERSSLFGIDKGLIAISDDFDEPLEEFKDYM